MAGFLVGGVGEDEMVHQFRHPAIVACLIGLAPGCEYGVRAAHRFDIALARFHRRMLVKVRRVAVEPAEITLIDGFRIVVERAVVTARVPFGGQRRRQLDFLGNLDGRQPVIGKAQRLVMHIFVHVALLLQEIDRAVLAPARPVMGGEENLRLAREEVHRFVDVIAPRLGVAHLRAARRVDVVHVAGTVLRHAERLELREIEIHLRRRFGIGRHLEDDFHTVDDELLARLANAFRRRHDGNGAHGNGLAQTGIDMALRIARQHRAIHVGRTAAHRIARQYVLAYRGFEEAFRRDDHEAVPDVLVRDHAAHAAIMVDMAVRVDDGGNGLVAALLTHELQRGGGRFGRDQRVDDDVARIALDEGDVRDVEIADLINARHDFEETVNGIELRLTPEARVYRVGAIATFGLESELAHIPDGVPRLVQHFRVRDRRDEAALCVLEILLGGGRQSLLQLFMCIAGSFRGVFGPGHGAASLICVAAE